MSKSDVIPLAKRTRPIAHGLTQQGQRKLKAFGGKENSGSGSAGRKALQREGIRKKIVKSNGPRRVLGAIDTRAQNDSSSPVLKRSSQDSDTEEAHNIKTRNAKIEEALSGLEEMARVFKERVDGIASEFEGLRDDVEALNLQYEALEVDYHQALESAKEERKTAEWYAGHLRNAEVQIKHLEQVVPEVDHPTAFSQAKW